MGKHREPSTRSARVHEAEVVNIMSYGAFCKLEEGVEGLVHISEMSWTKRINHPQRSGDAGPEGQGQGPGDQQGQAGNLASA